MDCLGLSTTYQSAGKWRFTDTESTVMANNYNTVEATANAEGITTEDNTVTQEVIWDHIRIVGYSFVAGDARVDTDVTVTMDVELHYDYDESDVVDGTVTVNGFATVYQSDGKWRFSDSESTVMANTYNTVVCTGNTEGITIEDNTVTQEVIWDKIVVISYTIVTPSGDSRISTGVTVTIDVELHYDYDSTDVEDGTVTVNGISASYQSLGKWRFTDSEATVILNTYDTVACTGNTHGITVEDNTVTQDIIWDRIKVVSYTIVTPSGDSRVDTDITVTIDVELHYDYDEADVVDGTVTVNALSTIYQSLGKWRFTDSEATVMMNTYDTVACTGNAHGIVTEDNTITLDVIWDRLLVIIQADAETVENGIQVNFTLTVVFDYDDTTCTTYQIGIHRNDTWWFSFTNGNKSLFKDTNTDKTYSYKNWVVTSEGTYDITVFTTNTESVTWTDVIATTKVFLWPWSNTTVIPSGIKGTSTMTIYALITAGGIVAIWGVLYYSNYGVSKGRKTMKRIGLSGKRNKIKKAERWFSDVGKRTDKEIARFLLRSKRKR